MANWSTMYMIISGARAVATPEEMAVARMCLADCWTSAKGESSREDSSENRPNGCEGIQNERVSIGQAEVS